MIEKKWSVSMFGERWEKGVKIEEKHFIVDGCNTFIFPDDLDFIGEVSNCDCFVDYFNAMILKRHCNNVNNETMNVINSLG